MTLLHMLFGTLCVTVTLSSPLVNRFVIRENHYIPRKASHHVVETTHGRVLGASNGITTSYKGIPYAMPPVGFLRWKPPQSPPSWHPRVVDATNDPPGCPQVNCGVLTPPIACPKTTSEDCLTLDIFVPLGTTNTSNLAVMVYIHGGNFFDMSASSPVFDGELFVQRGNVILVNINYRLGALGFLVTGSSETDATGNYGLYDQVLALKWVNANIQHFGGNPNKVTLFGQSAGAQSVYFHLTSEESSSLFHQVIAESSPVTLPYKTFNEAFTLAGLLARELKCPVTDMVCLRGASADNITMASWTTRSELASLKYLELFEPYGPYIDGTFVTGQPLDLYNKGAFAKKPIMLGTTSEETVLYIYSAFKKAVALEEYVALIAAVHPTATLKIVEKYPPSTTSADQREALVTMSTDLVFLCPNRNVTRSILREGETSVWVYQWGHAFSFPGWGPVTFCEGRVCHGSEIVYVFHTAYKANFTFTPDEETLSTDTITYWTNFARTGDPNDSGDEKEHDQMYAPQVWPKYNSADGYQSMYFQTPKSIVLKDFRGQYCDFWDKTGYNTVS